MILLNICHLLTCIQH